MAVICVDISRYQAGFHMPAFKAAGGLGVILKASEGTTIKDSSYDTHRSGALAAGLAVASYHFYRGHSLREAEWYLQCACPAAGERVVCDWEVSTITVHAVVHFLQHIHNLRPDLQLTVYSGHVAKENIPAGGDAWLAKHTSLWVAQYGSSVSWPKQVWPQWSLWQYSDTGKVAGFSGPVDTNRFNGPNENFLKWMGPAAPETIEPGPPLKPEPEEAPLVVMALEAEAPIRLRVRVGANVTIVDE